MDELLDLKRAKKKDKLAFERIINKYSSKLYVIAKSRLSNEEDIKDAIQETIMNSYINIHKLKDETKFNSWITSILINSCNKIYSQGKIKLVSYEEMGENNSSFKTDEDISKLNEKQSFQDIISFLEVEDRTIITLYYIEEYTTKDIAEILKINESTLRSRISRIKERIRKELE